jgi:hypothetical protein
MSYSCVTVSPHKDRGIWTGCLCLAGINMLSVISAKWILGLVLTGLRLGLGSQTPASE